MKKLRILAILVMLEIVLVMATSFSHPGAAFQDLKLVSVEFKEVDLRDALRILSAKTGVNIIASPEVEGKVTARFEREDYPGGKQLSIREGGQRHQGEQDSPLHKELFPKVCLSRGGGRGALPSSL